MQMGSEQATNPGQNKRKTDKTGQRAAGPGGDKRERDRSVPQQQQKKINERCKYVRGLRYGGCFRFDSGSSAFIEVVRAARKILDFAIAGRLVIGEGVCVCDRTFRDGFEKTRFLVTTFYCPFLRGEEACFVRRFVAWGWINQRVT